jgi:gamma-glutamylputrescine oxidase
MNHVEQRNPWLPDAPPSAASLRADLRCDVVVVGGGYTGLSAALSLAEAGADVVVLEAAHIGAGASGRNSGHLSTTVGNPAKVLLRSLGEERARTYFRFSDEAVRYAERLMEERGIDADYVAAGNISASVHPDHDARLEQEAAARRALGAEVSFLASGAMRERAIPPAFRCGLLHAPGGILDPGKYVRGLHAAAVAAGARVFEATPVERVEAGSPLRVVTDGAVVTADRLVLATNAFAPLVADLARLVIPLRVCCLETAPLDAAQRQALGWRGHEGVSTSHLVPESYRWTPRGGIAAGTRSVGYAWNSAMSSKGDEARFALLERSLRARFPMLGAIPVVARWGGWVAFTTDTLPVLGRCGAGGNIDYAMGYSGHGIAQGTFLGAILAARIRGDDAELAALAAPFTRKVLRWPPEPLRWLGANAAFAVLRSLDARTDRRVAAMRT